MPADEDYRSAAAALATSTTRTSSPHPFSPRSPVQRTSSPLATTTTNTPSSSSSNNNNINPQPPSPSWTRPTPSSFRRLSTRPGGGPRSRFNTSPSPSLQSRLLHTLNTLYIKSYRLFTSLSPIKRILALLALLALLTFVILALIYSHAIFTALGPVAEKWRALPMGWLIVWVLCFCTAFPPVMGYSTSVSIAGFVYGFPWGWPIVASATVAGSTVAFFTSRGIFSGYVHGLVGGDKRFVALAQVLRRDGLGVLAMIRFCPLPYSLSNGFLATVPSIRVGTFAAATALATPKLAIHVFIGSRLAILVENGDKMSGIDRAINYISMILFGIVGIAVGILIYQRTMARAAEIACEEGLPVGGDPLGNAAAATAEEIVSRDGADSDDDDLDFSYADDEEGTRLMRAGVGRVNGNVDPDAAALMNDDDDISLWETGGGYRDSWDEEAAVQKDGNGMKG